MKISDDTCEELENRMDELARDYADYNTRNKPAPDGCDAVLNS